MYVRALATLPRVAAIWEVPGVIPAASPVFRPIDATAVLEEVQLTLVVTSLVLPSLYVPVAVNCWGLRLIDGGTRRRHGDRLQRN